jgi:predicted ATP-grasp superfamily ATP-dependent carboligase
MTDKEKIISAIATINSMLALDFMTDPVREDLNKIKAQLEEVRDNLS